MTKIYRTVFLAGMATGICDISAACIVSAVRGTATPVQVLQSVASGWLGAESYEGGLATAALGLFFHFFIALNVGSAYVAASRKIPFLVRYPLIFGPLYGIAVFAVMYGVVIPLSAFPGKINFTTGLLIRGLFIHMGCVGSPAAIMTTYCSRRMEAQPDLSASPSESYQ